MLHTLYLSGETPLIYTTPCIVLSVSLVPARARSRESGGDRARARDRERELEKKGIVSKGSPCFSSRARSLNERRLLRTYRHARQRWSERANEKEEDCDVAVTVLQAYNSKHPLAVPLLQHTISVSFSEPLLVFALQLSRSLAPRNPGTSSSRLFASLALDPSLFLMVFDSGQETSLAAR
jgi:hypothetical protein